MCIGMLQPAVVAVVAVVTQQHCSALQVAVAPCGFAGWRCLSFPRLGSGCMTTAELGLCSELLVLDHRAELQEFFGPHSMTF